MAIMTTNASPVTTNMVGTSFKISETNGPKLMSMLSDFLYSDKEYAVISELSANAYDIHRIVGKSHVPIKVQLPTYISPEFVVRDYGTGLSKTDVIKFLTSYGESSKSDSNDQVGFWGLGSKSPAAVSSSWSIVSHFAGVCTHYEVFINDDGVPAITELMNAATAESGIEVRVPVSKNNFWAWEQAAKKAYTHYEVKPEINNNLLIPVVEYSHKTDEYGIVKNGYGGYSNSSIITTMREYKIDTQKVIDSGLLTDQQQDMFKSMNAYYSGNVHMFFDIGEIDLSISREQVQYNKKTIEAIVKKFIKIVDDITNDVNTTTAGITDGLQYRLAISNLVEKNQMRQIVEHIIKGNKFGVVNIPNDITNYRLPMPEGTVVYNGKSRVIDNNFRTWKTMVMYANHAGYDASSNKHITEFIVNISAIKNIVVVVDDLGKGTVSRIKHSGSRDTYYVVVTDNKFPDAFKVVNASSFDKPTPKPRAVGVKVKTDYYVLNGNSINLTTTEFDVATTVAVKVVNARQAREAGVFESQKIQFLKNLGYTILGFKGDVCKYKSPDEMLKVIHDDLVNHPSLVDNMNDYVMKYAFYEADQTTLMPILAKCERTDTEFDNIMEEVNWYVDGKKTSNIYAHRRPYKTTQHINYEAVCEFLGVDKIETTEYNWQHVYNVCKERYPMLTLILRGDENLEKISDYIKLVDSSLKGN